MQIMQLFQAKAYFIKLKETNPISASKNPTLLLDKSLITSFSREKRESIH